MKTLLLALLLLPVFCYSQAKKTVSTPRRQTPSMNGLGPFKIGQTSVADVAALCRSSGISLQESYSMHQTREAGDSSVAFVIPYESEEDYIDASPLSSPSPNVTVIYFSKFTVASIEVRELILKFYNKVLVEVSTFSPGELEEAFTLKYGPPIKSSLTSTSTCLYRLTGNKVPFRNETFFRRWYNGNIIAQSYLSKSHNARCEEELSEQFSIEDEAKMKLISASEEAVRKAASIKSKALKRSKLSDL
jgi:hypothetical protein